MNNSSRQTEHHKPRARILVIDDEAVALKHLRRILEKDGHRVSTFSNPVRALERLEKAPYDLIITDIRMPYMDGLALLNRAKRLAPGIEVILITGYASLDGAVEATRQGAYHYLSKPFTPEQVRKIVDKALGEIFLRREGSRSSEEDRPFIIGKSPKMARVEEVIRQIAPTDCSVLITGESGTGKELVARAIHARSPRAGGPFVAFNCGALSEELVANELFGHEREAFTGATSRKIGLLEAANGGTILLDEIGEMPLSMQVKLLRVLQEREVLRVGGTKPSSLDVRVLAATARDLKASVSEGIFRQDLFFRLNVVTIELPRLCERKEDIPLLAYHCLARAQRRMKKTVKAISTDAMDLLKGYAFPGNVRELENIIERAVAVCKGETIQVRDLPPDLADLDLHDYSRPPGQLMSLEDLERDYIRHVLKLTGGVRTRAAEILGIDRASLWRKMKKYGLS
ncbi:MAG: sigma-54-dependent Fis family transcriptional regulator [Deltaproteobacteria bacterium]|nr:sigma-54-dependent Fis family transcriptional regulator [Deltaproteobacteria bacterium]MBW2017290.1 sigma-54-dependent Fis family transcriptional regulator [Deltaproteobacteria bacterium]MBW2129738.1 sigma-54-dependent Fis family transcriptional regulator [Deltaproteobacteria bacterium]MBW2304341.1 sigma-54-dependent Fis family transcriptional regulator [Deltaproteobacteria bacterium]